MAKQILFIHSGTTFEKEEDYIEFLKKRPIRIESNPHWNETYINEQLDDFQIIKPKMPCKEKAKYEEWKIHFERHFPFLEDNLILIGFSLGGIFLSKYLSENKLPKKVLSTYLIAPPFDDTLPGEELSGGFELKENLELLEENNVKLLFSKDDDIVPLEHGKKYMEKLKKSKVIIYGSKNGHFLTPEFPELISMIKEDSKLS